MKVAEHLKLRYNDHMHKFYYNSAFGHSVFYSHYATLVVTATTARMHGNDCIVCKHNVTRVCLHYFVYF